jgi:hypothetical protein
LYKANKDQVTVFGFRTQYGGGKSTGFALIYDSHEALKKFEPHYRLVRIGAAAKIEKASRQQRMSFLPVNCIFEDAGMRWTDSTSIYRKATQKQRERVSGNGEDKGCGQGQEEISGSIYVAGWWWQVILAYGHRMLRMWERRSHKEQVCTGIWVC